MALNSSELSHVLSMLMYGAVFGCLISTVTDLRITYSIIFHFQWQCCWYFCQLEMFEILFQHQASIPLLFCPTELVYQRTGDWLFIHWSSYRFCLRRRSLCSAICFLFRIFLVRNGSAYKASQFCWWRSILACSVLVNFIIILCFTGERSSKEGETAFLQQSATTESCLNWTGVTSHHTYYTIIHFCILQTVTISFGPSHKISCGFYAKHVSSQAIRDRQLLKSTARLNHLQNWTTDCRENTDIASSGWSGAQARPKSCW